MRTINSLHVIEFGSEVLCRSDSHSGASDAVQTELIALTPTLF